MNVPAALLLALLAGLSDFIPVLGFFLSAAPVLVLGFRCRYRLALPLSRSTFCTTRSMTYYISPKVYGSSLQMSNLAVIAAFALGAELGGVVGALIALPLVAIYPVVEDVAPRPAGSRCIRDHRRIEDPTSIDDRRRSVFSATLGHLRCVADAPGFAKAPVGDGTFDDFVTKKASTRSRMKSGRASPVPVDTRRATPIVDGAAALAVSSPNSSRRNALLRRNKSPPSSRRRLYPARAGRRLANPQALRRCSPACRRTRGCVTRPAMRPGDVIAGNARLLTETHRRKVQIGAVAPNDDCVRSHGPHLIDALVRAASRCSPEHPHRHAAGTTRRSRGGRGCP